MYPLRMKAGKLQSEKGGWAHQHTDKITPWTIYCNLMMRVDTRSGQVQTKALDSFFFWIRSFGTFAHVYLSTPDVGKSPQNAAKQG